MSHPRKALSGRRSCLLHLYTAIVLMSWQLLTMNAVMAVRLSSSDQLVSDVSVSYHCNRKSSSSSSRQAVANNRKQFDDHEHRSWSASQYRRESVSPEVQKLLSPEQAGFREKSQHLRTGCSIDHPHRKWVSTAIAPMCSVSGPNSSL